MSGSPPADASRRAEKAQRVRLRFARGPEAAEIGHLDLARCWERAFRAAGIEVSYSQGNRPQPRITIAAGLPMGVTSEGELLDVVLAERTPPDQLAERLQPHLPAGFSVRDAQEVGMGLPSLASAVRWADYEVIAPGCADVSAAVESFLAAESFHWVDRRGEKTREYDLRALVQDLRVAAADGGVVRLSMRLRCDAAGVGRPDQVVKALGLPEAVGIHRVRLVLAETSPAREAWRRRGRYLE